MLEFIVEVSDAVLSGCCAMRPAVQPDVENQVIKAESFERLLGNAYANSLVLVDVSVTAARAPNNDRDRDTPAAPWRATASPASDFNEMKTRVRGDERKTSHRGNEGIIAAANA